MGRLQSWQRGRPWRSKKNERRLITVMTSALDVLRGLRSHAHARAHILVLPFPHPSRWIELLCFAFERGLHTMSCIGLHMRRITFTCRAICCVAFACAYTFRTAMLCSSVPYYVNNGQMHCVACILLICIDTALHLHGRDVPKPFGKTRKALLCSGP